jgi:capsular polysaccharide biosynthesis protein
VGSDPNRPFDVGSWLATLGRNWWVILGLVVLGAVVGGVVSLASPKEYSATSSVYIGQTTDANGNPMAGLNSNAKAATQLLASQAVLNEAAKKAGMEISAEMLRGGIAVETPSATKTGTSAINIVVITVTDTNPQRAAAAANALAAILVERISPGVNEKIAVLEQQLADDKASLAASIRRTSAAQAALRRLLGQNGGQDSTAAALYVAVVQAAATDQQTLQAAIQKTELVLLTAKQAEQPRILHEAVPPSSPSGPVLAVNVAAGALAGFVIGVLVATFRGRLTRRPRPEVGTAG